MLNKRLDVINALGKHVYCILSGKEDMQQQINSVFAFESGMGYSAQLTDDSILIKDYFHDDTVAKFEILSITDTNENVVLHWLAAE